MSEQNSRDIQFAGFAKALVIEIINQVPATIYPLEIDISDRLETLLARRAYDLVKHVMHVMPYLTHDSSIRSEDTMSYIPDMTEWTKEQ